MRYRLLSSLYAGPLPAIVSNPSDILDIAILQAAGMIEAVLPQAANDGGCGYDGPAAVTRVTTLGLEAIKRHCQ